MTIEGLPENLTQLTDVAPKAYGENDYFDFQYGSGVIERLIGSWGEVINETERQRRLRYVKSADSDKLREAGILKADEMYAPVRLIDANIRAEQPPTIAYLTQSRRSIIFATADGTTIEGLEKLEANFTTVARYLGWEIPWMRVIDGDGAHGWDSMEILFDVDAPGHFALEAIGHDCLIFSQDCEDLEAQECIAIKKNLTPKQLRSLVKQGFVKDQVEKVIGKSKNGAASDQSVDITCTVFKVFFKKDEIVHTLWYGRGCDGYLREAEPLFLGMRDITQAPVAADPMDPMSLVDYPPEFETTYPIVLKKYIESNDPRIVEIYGRVKLDEASQEAASAIQSSFVNGCLRASNIYAAPKATAINSAPNANPALTTTVLANGGIYDNPLEFFHTPYPPGDVMKAAQGIVTQNKQEQGAGINFSVLNRQDSGKTATEVQAASQKSTELTSVQVILLSIFVRMCYAKCWRIYQNRVLQGAITIKDPYLLMLFGEGIQADPSTMQVINCSGPKDYIIKSSGDVDVIQRKERLQQLMQGWDVFSKTALAPEYLKDIIRYAFPEDASRYVGVLEQAEMDEINRLKQLVTKLGSVVQALAVNPDGSLRPEVAQHGGQLQQLQQEAMMLLGNGEEQQQPAQA